MLSDLVLAILAGGLSGLASYMLLARFGRPRLVEMGFEPERIAFSFDETGLKDANRAAQLLFDEIQPEATKWADLKMRLAPRFEHFPKSFDEMHEMLKTAGDDALEFYPFCIKDVSRLTVRRSDEKLIFVIEEPDLPNVVDRHLAFTRRAELKRTYRTLDQITEPLWTSASDGSFLWGNKAYINLLSRTPDAQNNLLFPPCQKAHPLPDVQRYALVSDKEKSETHWFDISSVELDEDRLLNVAVNIDRLIQAETAQRKFVQTLAKTFAQLSTGLAIFDRNRKLVLFNQSLVDLTGLSGQFLSGQPDLQSFFDQLRENRILPEPKDYSGWRKQIADLVVQSTDGRYEETWHLPEGRTFRIVGRPHPDGAVAFLLEDVSVEMSLSQQFRGQVALSNMALDTMENAVVAFSETGQVLLCNRAFRTFMDMPLGETYEGKSLDQLRAFWDKKFKGVSLQAFVSGQVNGSETGSFALRDGRILRYLVNSADGYSKAITLYTSALDELPPSYATKDELNIVG